MGSFFQLGAELKRCQESLEPAKIGSKGRALATLSMYPHLLSNCPCIWETLKPSCTRTTAFRF